MNSGSRLLSETVYNTTHSRTQGESNMSTIEKLRLVTDQLEELDREESHNHQREVYLLLNALTDMVLVSDIEGTIIFANPSTFKIVGYDPQELIGEHVCDVLDCDDIGNRIDTSITTTAKTKNGVHIPVHIYVGSIDGNLVVSIIRKL